MTTPAQIPRWRSFLVAAAIVGLLAAGAPGHAADESNPTAPAIDPEVREFLHKMSTFLAGTKRFRVEMEVAHDAVQASGRIIEFNEKRTLMVSRPKGLRVDSTESDGHSQRLLYDGEHLSLITMPANVYARSAVSGTVDDAVKHFVNKLGMRLPLAALLMTSFPTEFDRRLQAAQFVETTSVFGAPAHHIAGTVNNVDFQIWVADGDKPLPQRIILTYKRAAGQPQFRARFREWDLDAKIDDKKFGFSVPPGAHQITFASELAQIEAVAPPPSAGGGQ